MERCRVSLRHTQKKRLSFKRTLEETPGILKQYQNIFIFSLRSIPRSPQRLFLHQDGGLYQMLPPGGAETNPVSAEVGVRNPHKRYIWMCSHTSLLSGVFSIIFIFITFTEGYSSLIHLDFPPIFWFFFLCIYLPLIFFVPLHLHAAKTKNTKEMMWS